jgi:ABC-type proline/glycine betaine transport system substrate-binding protein
MTRLMTATAICALSAGAAFADCETVTFSDVGWTDITATTAATSVVLEALGYETETLVLSVPVTYTSLAEGDVDIFLGNWMPTMEADIAPYREAGHGRHGARQPRWARSTRWPPTRPARRWASRISGISPGPPTRWSADLRDRARQ